ncbi:MAG: ABC transporter ATP-binding protein [Flavobacteriaceae bacterium]
MEQQNNHTILEVKDLTIGYVTKKSTSKVQEGINLSIQKGKLVSILGKNGIGKSTFLRTITKLQNAISGTILLDNKKIDQYDYKELSKKVSMVLTERLPESQLTVFELVALGRQPHTNWIDKLQKEDIDAVTLALQQTDTEDLSKKRFFELSDGQLQRVLIARALAQDTEIIILDEPTAHLDIHHTIKIFQLLKNLVVETGKTIIISSHEVNLAIQFSNQLILLTANKTYSGTTKELVAINAFESLFPPEVIKFNTSLEQFIINKN